MRTIYRNILAIIVVTSFYFLVIVGPKYYKEIVELRCGPYPSQLVETFSDKKECYAYRLLNEELKYCVCRHPRQLWAVFYYRVLIPLVYGIGGFILFRGSLLLKLILLTSAVVSGGVLNMVYSSYVYTGQDPIGIALFAILLDELLFAFTAGIVLILQYMGSKYLWKGKGLNST